MAEEQRAGTGSPYAPQAQSGAPHAQQTPNSAQPAYNPAEPGFGFRMMVEPPEANGPQKENGQTTPAPVPTPAAPPTQTAPVPVAPVEQVTVSVAANAEEAESENGKKSHRRGSKRRKTAEQPLPDERAPARPLSTKRGLIRFLFFTLVTGGIYTLFFTAGLAEDMNLLASRHDGRRTPNLLLLPFITVLTLGIGYFVYWHRFAARIREEVWRRGIDYTFGPGKFWGWGLFGILLFGIGPLIFFHKLCVALNKLSADYNLHG